MNNASSNEIVKSFRIEAKTGYGFQINKGQRLRIVDLEGEQVADLVCFALDHSQEYLSSGRSINYAGNIYLSSGDVLYSNRSNPMLTIETDQVGKHDFLFPPCSQEMFAIEYDIYEPHPNCLENLTQSLKPFGIVEAQIPIPFNVFMNAHVSENGEITIRPPLSKAGDYIEFLAEMDLMVAVSACSALRCNNFSWGPIGMEIRENEQK
ncbi:MAG: urea carboxylase-associated family protein [Desulfobacteraceae bacterium]|jgi:uncharacterized protein YcgI (DUF1989 family)